MTIHYDTEKGVDEQKPPWTHDDGSRLSNMGETLFRSFGTDSTDAT